MIAQAWAKHEADRLRTSWGPEKVRQILVAEHEAEMRSFVNDEIFVQPLDLCHSLYALGGPADGPVSAANESLACEKGAKDRPFLTEVYTTSQNVSKEAARRGHRVGDALSLETGWNFLIPSHREAAEKKIAEEKPYCLVLAFPCGPFSPLQRLNQKDPGRLAVRQLEGRVLMDFALRLAKLQMDAGRHCVLENPKPSGAWDEPPMKKFLEENDVHVSQFDQCRFGLRSVEGVLHRKPTKVASSSSKVCQELDGRVCMRNHVHPPFLEAPG